MARRTYCLCDVVYYHGTVGVAIVHGCQRLVSLLPCCVPYLELYCGLLVECNRLREECGADSRFSVVVELVLYQGDERLLQRWWRRGRYPYLDKAQHKRTLSHGRLSYKLSALIPSCLHFTAQHTQQHQLELCKARAAAWPHGTLSRRHQVRSWSGLICPVLSDYSCTVVAPGCGRL